MSEGRRVHPGPSFALILMDYAGTRRLRPAWAIVEGRMTIARVPLPGSDSIQARPPCSSAQTADQRKSQPGAAGSGGRSDCRPA